MHDMAGLPFWITLIVLAITLVALMREMGPPDIIFVAALVVLVLCRVVSPKEAFAGFSSPSVLMVGALFMVAAALRETGAMDHLGQRFLGKVGSEQMALIWVSVVAVISSAFLNNTTIVAMLLPVILDWCCSPRTSHASASSSKAIQPHANITPMSLHEGK